LRATVLASLVFLVFIFEPVAAARGESAAALFPRAIVDKKDVATAVRTEWDLRTMYEVLPTGNEPWFTVLEGTSSVLVSAPHATAQTREGKLKFADSGTGALAVMLNALAKTTTIYTTRMSPSDPNFYDDNAYKEKLKEIIQTRKPKLVLDLHGSHWYRPYDLDFGTMNGASITGHQRWLRRLADHLGKAGLRDFSQDFFPAAQDQTVTKFVHALHVPCLQLEFNETWLTLFDDMGIKTATEPPKDISEDMLRVDEDGAHRFASMLEALVRFVQSVDKEDGKSRR
jgi:hypothetical protein